MPCHLAALAAKGCLDQIAIVVGGKRLESKDRRDVLMTVARCEVRQVIRAQHVFTDTRPQASEPPIRRQPHGPEQPCCVAFGVTVPMLDDHTESVAGIGHLLEERRGETMSKLIGEDRHEGSIGSRSRVPASTSRIGGAWTDKKRKLDSPVLTAWKTPLPMRSRSPAFTGTAS